MKTGIQTFGFSILVLATLPAFSQKYKTPADTVKLNREYAKISSDIADLTAELNKTKNDLPTQKVKATDANAEAKTAASSSDLQASKATNGSIKDAKKEDRKAKKALKKAKEAESADKKVSNDADEIDKLTSKISKKKERLQQLDAMRAKINAQVITPAIAPIQNK